MLILASASPRRRELLRQIGVPHIVQAADIDETPLPHETPGDYVQRLACSKASHIFATRADSIPVLGADTTVAIDGLALGKPADDGEHRAM